MAIDCFVTEIEGSVGIRIPQLVEGAKGYYLIKV